MAESIPGFDDPELLQTRTLHARQGRTDEYAQIVARLRSERTAYLDGFHGLDTGVTSPEVS